MENSVFGAMNVGSSQLRGIEGYKWVKAFGAYILLKQTQQVQQHRDDHMMIHQVIHNEAGTCH